MTTGSRTLEFISVLHPKNLNNGPQLVTFSLSRCTAKHLAGMTSFKPPGNLDRRYYHSHFTDTEIEAQRSDCPSSSTDLALSPMLGAQATRWEGYLGEAADGICT